jgi:hypothetical protein
MTSDLDEWEIDEPSPGFAERVIDAVRAPPRKRPRRLLIVAGGLVLAGAAAAAFVAGPRTPHGEAQADGVREVAIGPRAIAVLEPGARIAWTGDVVTQARGGVFYRVEPGTPFRVKTLAGDVAVKGTCFRVKVEEDMRGRDVKIAGVSAVLGAAALVGVYEGKVALTHPSGQAMDLAAGESAVSNAEGLRKTDGMDRASGDKDPLAAANASLADSVRAYQGRLAAIEEEKRQLEKDLADAQDKLAASADGAVALAKRNEFDITDDDWKRLAKDGIVKVRYPCDRPSTWDYSPKSLNKLGLRPDDGKAVAAALAASQKRRWAVIRPLCAQALAGAFDVADKVGEDACIAIVQTMANQKDSAAAEEAVRLAAEVRAGLRPPPGPDDPINPVERMMLALTGESKAIEADLTRSIGPDDAHVIMYGDEGCWHNSRWHVGPRGADDPSP